MLEREVADYLVERTKAAGGEIRKVIWEGRSNAPDRRLMLFRPNYMPCWVETKATGKKPTEAQKREHERMRQHGEIVHVVDSVESVDALFKN